jgi:aminobenzoyl-glutamate transport protein
MMLADAYGRQPRGVTRLPSMTTASTAVATPPVLRPLSARVLDAFERFGNRCPDPVVLFLAALAITWVTSSLLAGRDFGLIDPRTGAPLAIRNQLTLPALAQFLTGLTHAFVTFAPLGMVLVMAIGVGIAERSGLVGAALRGILSIAPDRLLTPLVALASVVAHVLSDSATVILVPLAGALFYVAGRHPLAGIVAAFTPLFGSLFANFVPSALDALLAGFTEAAARIVVPGYSVNPLSNYWLSVATAVVVVPVTWWLVDRVVTPRVAPIPVDGDPAFMPTAPALTSRERQALGWSALTTLVLTVAFLWAVVPGDSPFRAPDGTLTGPGAPLMQALIPLLLVVTALPSIAYGMAAGTLRSHRDVVDGMAATMASLGYYVVMVFFAAIFTKAFADSNLGALIALEGAETLRSLALPGAVTLVGVVFLTAGLDVLVPSASAKWALVAPILVPMLLAVGIAPELTQAAFRVGDGPVNLVTPLMPHFPLVLAFGRRYVTGLGIGTLMSLVLPFGVAYLLLQIGLLLLWWLLELPLGVASRLVYP